eukprot:2572408-Amphidinium_carterae.1
MPESFSCHSNIATTSKMTKERTTKTHLITSGDRVFCQRPVNGDCSPTSTGVNRNWHLLQLPSDIS